MCKEVISTIQNGRGRGYPGIKMDIQENRKVE
jgi:hypothetical protein